ncbi:MAG: SDR family NAD(P)-dependent oxidoreductase [Bacteroidetes bacterium]|nr:SDR family NAD(P)-dependent oxidoreductase [Bacteroidota bacterium]
MENKNIVITGANAGLGFETARALAKMDANVMMLCRSLEKGTLAADKIRAEYPSAKLQVLPVLLESQQNIRQVALKIREEFPVIDVLVNNAGTWISELTFTEDKVESMFAINHLAYFLLTHALYPNLILAKEPRVVSVASDSHFQGKINFEDIHLTKNYHGLRAYAQSKLANIHFMYELNRRKPAEHLSTFAVQPGLVKTDIGVKKTNWLHALAWKLRRSGGVSPEVGAQTQIFLASNPSIHEKSGLYWDKCKPKSSSADTYKIEDAEKLWDLCCEFCKIDDFFKPDF